MTGQKAAAYFSIDLLFDKPIDFNLEEVAQAVSIDYPTSAVCVHPVNTGKHVKTNSVVLGMLKPLDDRNGHVVVMNGIGHPDEEFRTADHSEIAWRSGAFAHQALTAIKTHQSYMTFSVQTSDTSLDGKYRAVRQLMAVSAVFAELPICLGVLVHWSSHMVSAATWVEGTQNAMRGEWPVYSWVSFRCGWDVQGSQPNTFAVGYTKGLRSFLGFELHIATAPITPSDGKLFLKDASLALLETGYIPDNGSAFSLDSHPQHYTVSRPAGLRGAPSPVIVLVHPAAPENGNARHVATKHRGQNRPAPDFLNVVLSARTASG